MNTYQKIERESAIQILATIFFAACFLCSSCAANERMVNCEHLPEHIKLKGQAKTVNEIELASLAQVKENSNVPQVPFGLANKEWMSLRELMLPNDQIFQASNVRLGWEGYVVLRGRCVIGYQITTVM